MPQVTDPALLAQLGDVTVSDGRKGVSSSEAKEAVDSRSEAGLAADFVRGIAQVEALNRLLPTGRFAAGVNEIAQRMPSGWQTKDVSNYQTMAAASRGLLMPGAALQSGQKILGSQINSAPELAYWASTLPMPNQEKEAVTNNVNRLGALAQRRIAQENFNNVWRQKLGSLDKLNAKGETAQQAFESSLGTPRMAVLNKPISQYLTEVQQRRMAAQKKSNVPADVDAILSRYGVK